MSAWLSALVSLAVLAALCGMVCLRRKPRPPMELPRFDFDKTKSYEREGRKFPFSY